MESNKQKSAYAATGANNRKTMSMTPRPPGHKKPPEGVPAGGDKKVWDHVPYNKKHTLDKSKALSAEHQDPAGGEAWPMSSKNFWQAAEGVTFLRKHIPTPRFGTGGSTFSSRICPSSR